MELKTDFKKLSDKNEKMADYIVEQITYICKNIDKRGAGSKGEHEAAKYMAKILKEDCGCDTADVEAFKENPNSFYGWIYITFTLIFIGMALLFVAPVASILLIVLGFVLAFLQFGLYKKAVDKFFPEKEGHNVYAVKKCTGELKRRIIFNGHIDAAWEWPMNYRFGFIGFDAHMIIAILGAVYYLVLSIITAVKYGALSSIQSDPVLFKCYLWGLLFLIPMIGMYFLWNEKRVVDGANDDLTGSMMSVAVMKALKEEGIEFENTEICVVLSGSEEAGLRGSLAWSEKHKNEMQDVPTFIYSLDTIYQPEHLSVNYRDLNGTLKADEEVCDLFLNSAKELGIKCEKGMIPPLGGATDSAGFCKHGLRATGISAMNHQVPRIYHTRLDTPDTLNKQALSDCYQILVRVLQKFDNGEHK